MQHWYPHGTDSGTRGRVKERVSIVAAALLDTTARPGLAGMGRIKLHPALARAAARHLSHQGGTSGTDAQRAALPGLQCCHWTPGNCPVPHQQSSAAIKGSLQWTTVMSSMQE